MVLPCAQIRTPLIKLEKSKKMFYGYLFLIVLSFVQLHLFVFPHKHFHYLVLPINILFTVINVCFLKAAFMNPGRVESNKSVSFDKIVERQDPNSLCPSCETIFTDDSRHCYYCD